MDEDYDACDLENWFLAIQSADGSVIIPSFHRPGIIRADPTDAGFPQQPGRSNATTTTGGTPRDSAARFLRPRNVDGHDASTFPDLLPNQTTGKITYDVDNDGDGITDSVWLDLGFPATRNASGSLYKPLFAFTIIGLNGRLPLNTAGNLQHRDSTNSNNVNANNVPLPNGQQLFGPASRLGNSPSEVDISFALQNADDRNNRLQFAQRPRARSPSSLHAVR